MRFNLKPINQLIGQLRAHKPANSILMLTSPFCSDTSTTSSLQQKSSSRITFSQRWQKIDNGYQQFKSQYKTSASVFEFLLEKGLFAIALAWLGHEVKDYIETRNHLATIQMAVDKQALENAALLESKRALTIQPKLYLTTVITDKDLQEHQQNQRDFSNRIQQLNDYQNQSNQIKSKLAGWSHFYTRNQVVNALNHLLGTLTLQLERLDIAKSFDESIWLQKNRQYSLALSKLQQNVIAKLEPLSLQDKPTLSVLNTQRLLIATYNAQAKLNACLSKTSQALSEQQKYSDASLASYEKAVALSKPELGVEHAILLSSLAYLQNDRKEPEKAFILRQQALAIKPNDEHILCGMGLDLHHMEQQKDKAQHDDQQLDLAYGYFTKALLLNNQEPNIYVSRGLLLLDMGHTEEAFIDFVQALKINPHHTEANLQKAKCLVKLNKCEEAVKHLQLSLTTQVDNSIAIQAIRQDIINYQQTVQSSCKLQGLRFFSTSSKNPNQQLIISNAEDKPENSNVACTIC